VQSDVRAYYHTIAPFITAELAERGDETFWRSIARSRRGGRVLELGAGSGRITALLAPQAREVVALDISPDMLRLARERLAKHHNVRFLQADMRTLDLRVPFDLVVAADDPFSHLASHADRMAALLAVARHLTPKGRFVLDALWQSPDEMQEAGGDDGRVSDRVVREAPPRLRVREQWRCHPRSHTGSAAYEYYVGDHLAARASFHARYWTADELDQLFADAGLRITHRWGSYARTHWDCHRSRKLIVEATLNR
jgi:ubiquinone/menaquinone biosynthesis C-methylase UbiE